jgi:putative membrane protein
MTRFSKIFLVGVFGGAMALMGGAVAQENGGSSTGSMAAKNSAGTTSHDTTFIRKAAAGGLAEVELGQLAQEKASSPDVKKFGERMVTDHSKANEQLKQIAAQAHVKVPTQLDAKDKATKARLEKLSGEQFDQAYMKDMVKDHQKDVSEFERESKSAKDPAVKDFATQTLPILQEHLKEAQRLAPATGSGEPAKSGQ